MPSEVTAENAAPAGAAARWWRAWMRWPVSALWLFLFGLAILASGTTAWLEASGRTDEMSLGLGVRAGTRGLMPFGPDAIKSGIRAGDRVIAVNGRPIVPGGPPPPSNGNPVLISVRSADGAESQHILTPSSGNVDRYYAGTGVSSEFTGWFNAIAAAIGNIVLITAGAMLFRRGRHQLVPTLLSFAFVAIGLTIMNNSAADWLGLALWRMRVLISGWTLFILAILLFPDGRFAWRWHRWLAWALAVATMVVVSSSPDIWGLWTGLHTLLLVVAAASLIFRYRALPPGSERQQVRWALFGFIAGSFALLPGVYLSLTVLVADFQPSVIIWSGIAVVVLLVVTVVLIAGGLLVSLIRYRLYDAEAVISRSVSIGALTLALLTVFAGTEKIIELLGEEYFGERLGVLAGGIGAAFAALMIVPLHHRLSHWAEHKFQKQLIRLRHGLPLLVGDMRETAPVKRIAAATLDGVGHGVRASRSALLFEGELLDARGIEVDAVETWLTGWTPPPHQGSDIDKADATFPLRVPLAADGHGRIGWLLLGPRPDGSFYGKDERETLEQIADPVARALEIAAAREKRDAEEQRRWRTQESLNAEIKTVNGELVRILGSLDAKLALLVPLPPAQAADDGSPGFA